MFSYYDNFEDKDFRGDYTLLIAGWLRACDFVGFVDSRLPRKHPIFHNMA